MNEKLKHLIITNVILVVSGIPGAWLVGVIFSDGFTIAEIIRTTIVAVVLLNIPLIFKHFSKPKKED